MLLLKDKFPLCTVVYLIYSSNNRSISDKCTVGNSEHTTCTLLPGDVILLLQTPLPVKMNYTGVEIFSTNMSFSLVVLSESFNLPYLGCILLFSEQLNTYCVLHWRIILKKISTYYFVIFTWCSIIYSWLLETYFTLR